MLQLKSSSHIERQTANASFAYLHICRSSILFLAFAICSIMMESCKSKPQANNITTFDITSASECSINDVFSDVEIVPLLFGKNYPSVVRSILVADEKIFILDDKAILHIFKSDGQYLACSNDKFGNGPGEYSIMMGFSWNPYIKAIEILTPNKLLIFDETFNLLRQVNIPTKVGKDNILYDEIYDLSETRHILHTTSNGAAPYRIDLFDSESGKIIDMKSYADEVTVKTTMQPRSFYNMPDNSIFFTTQAITDAFYSLNNIDTPNDIERTLSKTITINVGNEVTKKDVKQYDAEPAKYAEYIYSTSKNVRLRVLPNSKKIFAIYKAGNTPKSIFTGIIDRKSGKSLKIKLYSEGEYAFPFLEDVDESHAYAAIEKEMLENRAKILINKAEQADSILNSIEDESLVLLKYKIR